MDHLKGYDLLPEPEDLGDLENSKENRCIQFAAETAANSTTNLSMYLENTSKEELVLEHVLEY